MRVIAGKARRLQLKTSEGMDTRPTQDRTKETLFNMINNEIPGCSFLDLYSGSGGIGIEAASRGAARCVFVENNKKAYDCIKQNLAFTKLSDVANVMFTSVMQALETLNQKGEAFDIIFMDPPYNHLYEKEVLQYLVHSKLISEDTLIIIEASKETSFDYCSEMGFQWIKEKLYKTNKHVLIRLGGE